MALDLSGEVHDFELSRMVADLKQTAEIARSRALIASKPMVVEDDLQWLMDKEESTPLAAMAANEDHQELTRWAEHATKQRIAYGNIRNLTLRRQAKLEQLQEELRLQQQEAIDTPRDKRRASDNLAQRDATQGRVEQMEKLADEQVEYTLTLHMMIKRMREAKGGGEEMLSKVREKIATVEAKKAKQTSENGIINHAHWQSRNAMKLQGELNDGGRRARQQLVQRRKNLLSKGRGDVDSLSDELVEKQEEQRRSELAAAAEADVQLGVHIIQKRQVAGRLRRLEEQFRRVQELMGGFPDMDEVVEKLIEQQGASGRMDQLKSDTIARHETLVEEKARLDLAYEEQLGGVDSELNKRRHDIDAFVKAEEESQQLMSERKARLDVASLTLTKAHIGLSELEQRLLSVPRIQLRGNIVLRGGANGRDRDALSTIADDACERRSDTSAPGGGRTAGAIASVPEEGADVAGWPAAAEPVAGGEAAAAAAAASRATREGMAQATSSQLEAMREAEVQMMRTLTHCESELSFLLHEIEARSKNRSTAAAAAPAAMARGAASREGSDSGSFLTRHMDGHLDGHSSATTYDYGRALRLGSSSGPFGAHNVRVRELEDETFITQDMAIEGTLQDLNRWREERSQLRSQALGLPAARGVAPNEVVAQARRLISGGDRHADDRAAGGTPLHEHGASSARVGGERRGSCDHHPGSAPIRRGSTGGGGSCSARPVSTSGRTKGSAVGLSREASKSSSQSSVVSGASLRAPKHTPRAPSKPQPFVATPRAAGGGAAKPTSQPASEQLPRRLANRRASN